MSDPVVQVRGLSKLYHKSRRAHDSFREEVVDGLRRLFARSKERLSDQQFWALRDVSFSLEKGDVLGVVGPNGAGKSTLLKILSEVTAPTEGEIIYHGELTPILEIGTGFHPDLSGRENIFLNSAVLGMSRAEMDERLAAILEFSGVEEFIDTAVKHYSSGMYLRLAFAVAFHADIDILVLDEVLAVGDAAFQQKSFDRIVELARSGATIVLASHSNRQIMELCNKCLWLEQGRVRGFGPAQRILEEYLEEVLDQQVQQADQAEKLPGFQRRWPATPNATTTASYRMNYLKVSAKGKAVEDPIYHSDTIVIDIGIHKLTSGSSMEVGIRLFNMEGTQVLLDSYGFRTTYQASPRSAGDYHLRITVPPALLNQGLYTINVLAASDSTLDQEWPQLLKFRLHLHPDEQDLPWEHHAVLRIPLEWELNADAAS